MSNAAKYPWESNAVYEPVPLPRSYGRPRGRTRYILLALAALAMASGALIAFGQLP